MPKQKINTDRRKKEKGKRKGKFLLRKECYTIGKGERIETVENAKKKKGKEEGKNRNLLVESDNGEAFEAGSGRLVPKNILPNGNNLTSAWFNILSNQTFLGSGKVSENMQET